MSISAKLKEILDEIMCEDCGCMDEDIEEASTTAGVPGYQTPYAFTGDDEESKKKKEKQATNSTGYKVVKEMYDQNYPSFKKDDTKNSRQKVNGAIREINRRLFQIERIINRTAKLKQEAGVTSDKYWKSTGPRMNKIAERLLKVSRKLREMAG
jgi:hypothetical protein